MTLSSHAATRAQQRCIPPVILEWLLAYGRREPSHGAVRVSFDRKARKELALEIGKPLVSQIGRFLSVSAIVAPQSDHVITVMWRY